MPELTEIEMFGTETASVEKRIEEMSIFIAVEDNAVAELYKEHSQRKAALDQLKSDLSMLMRENGMESCKLANGLNPKAKIVRKFFKQSEVADEQLHQWLVDNELGDIIKPYVHFQTLQATMKSFLGEVPDTIFNVSDVPTVTMYGKSKFLAGRKELV